MKLGHKKRIPLLACKNNGKDAQVKPSVMYMNVGLNGTQSHNGLTNAQFSNL